jgi:hypothetical protein
MSQSCLLLELYIIQGGNIPKTYFVQAIYAMWLFTQNLTQLQLHDKYQC